MSTVLVRKEITAPWFQTSNGDTPLTPLIRTCSCCKAAYSAAALCASIGGRWRKRVRAIHRLIVYDRLLRRHDRPRTRCGTGAKVELTM